MRRIFELAKVARLQVDCVQSLTRREICLSSQVEQAKSSRGSSAKKGAGSSGKKSGGDSRKKGSQSFFSSAKSPKSSSPLSPLSRSKTNRRALRTETMENSTVKQDKAANKFRLDLGNNQEAHIDYKRIGKNKLELYHSEVPSELRGRGIGRALAVGAFELAASNNTKLKLTCSYLEHCMNKLTDPKFKKLVE